MNLRNIIRSSIREAYIGCTCWYTTADGTKAKVHIGSGACSKCDYDCCQDLGYDHPDGWNPDWRPEDDKVSPGESQIRKTIKEELSRMPDMEKDISRDEIIEILNEIYELQLEKAPAIAQRRLEELFEKIGIGFWSYPSSTN